MLLILGLPFPQHLSIRFQWPPHTQNQQLLGASSVLRYLGGTGLAEQGSEGAAGPEPPWPGHRGPLQTPCGLLSGPPLTPHPLGGPRHPLYLRPLSPFPLVNGGVYFLIITIFVNYLKHTGEYRNSTTNTGALITLSGRRSCFPVSASALFLQNPITQPKSFLPRSLPELPPSTRCLPVHSPCLLLYTHVPCVPTHAFPPTLRHEL